MNLVYLGNKYSLIQISLKMTDNLPLNIFLLVFSSNLKLWAVVLSTLRKSKEYIVFNIDVKYTIVIN